MKKLLKSRFLPPDFEQILYQQYQSCKQGNRTVAEYAEEFYRLSSRVDINESEYYMISRLKNGLRWDIEEKVALQSFFKLNDIVMASERAESLLERGKSRTRNVSSMSNFQYDRCICMVGSGPNYSCQIRERSSSKLG